MSIATIEAIHTVEFHRALESAARRAQAVYPSHSKRIWKGLALAMKGHVDMQADGTALVQSETNPAQVYTVNGRCTCPDEPTAPKGYCKHRYAKAIYKKALEAYGPWWATYTDPTGRKHRGTASKDAQIGCWLFVPEDGADPLYVAPEALSLGGHIATAEKQWKQEGNLASKVCGNPEASRCAQCGYIGCRGNC